MINYGGGATFAFGFVLNLVGLGIMADGIRRIVIGIGEIHIESGETKELRGTIRNAGEGVSQSREGEALTKQDEKLDKNIERAVRLMRRDLAYAGNEDKRRIDRLRVILRALEDIEGNPDVLKTEKGKKISKEIVEVLNKILTLGGSSKFISYLVVRLDKVQKEEDDILSSLKQRYARLNVMENYVRGIEKKTGLLKDERERTDIIKDASTALKDILECKKELENIINDTSANLNKYKGQIDNMHSNAFITKISETVTNERNRINTYFGSKEGKWTIDDVRSLKQVVSEVMNNLSSRLRLAETYSDKINGILKIARETRNADNDLNKRINDVTKKFSDMAKKADKYLYKEQLNQ